MRNVKDILNKWWNVLGKRRSWFPYSFTKNARGGFEFSGGTDWSTITIRTNGTHYYGSYSSSANTIRVLSLPDIAPGTTVTLTDELAPRKVKYLKVGNHVIFDDR